MVTICPPITIRVNEEFHCLVLSYYSFIPIFFSFSIFADNIGTIDLTDGSQDPFETGKEVEVLGE